MLKTISIIVISVMFAIVFYFSLVLIFGYYWSVLVETIYFIMIFTVVNNLILSKYDERDEDH